MHECTCTLTLTHTLNKKTKIKEHVNYNRLSWPTLAIKSNNFLITFYIFVCLFGGRDICRDTCVKVREQVTGVSSIHNWVLQMEYYTYKQGIIPSDPLAGPITYLKAQNCKENNAEEVHHSHSSSVPEKE